jgi:hypothetical protein
MSFGVSSRWVVTLLIGSSPLLIPQYTRGVLPASGAATISDSIRCISQNNRLIIHLGLSCFVDYYY